jgi:hypothetical protein
MGSAHRSCCSSGDIVVANEILDHTDMLRQLFGDGECRTHETVVDVEFIVAHWQSTCIAVDLHPADNIMHLDRLRKADRHTHETRDVRPSRQMWPCNLLGVTLAGIVLCGVEVTPHALRSPMQFFAGPLNSGERLRDEQSKRENFLAWRRRENAGHARGFLTMRCSSGRGGGVLPPDEGRHIQATYGDRGQDRC